MSKIKGSDFFGGNRWSKFLAFLSFIFLCLTGITLISKIQTYDPISQEIISSEIPWKIAILLFALSLITGYISYRLAGGRRNPAIWKDADLYSLLVHTEAVRECRIGFHALRDQKLIIDKLKSIGLTKRPSKDTRQFITPVQ
ncbi:MAG: hypothetical protein HY805_06110 [Nitrospirae bacterium]|nr:hypothetical protein [Nitrospirota bacterium]